MPTVEASERSSSGALVRGSFQDVIEQRLHTYGADYAKAAAPRSPLSTLSGNRSPNHSRLDWLRNRAKCNQFVGDILTEAGYEMPRYRMPDRSEHYVNAEALLRFPQHFERLSRFSELRPGDLILNDNLSRSGENGAHVEVVYASKSNTVYTAGARTQGAQLRPRPLQEFGSFDAARGSYLAEAVETWLLRPIRRLP